MEELEREIKILPGDPHHYPGNDPKGYFTTFDIVRIFPEIRMEKFQDWLRRGFIKPQYKVECSTGFKKYFNPSQLYMIAVFQKLLGFGVKRDYADIWARAFHNLRHDLKEKDGPDTEPDFIVFEKSEKMISQMTLFTGPVEFKPGIHGNDMGVIAMFEINLKIRRELQK